MTENKTKANTLWGGRFEGGVSDIMEKINASIDFDKKLYRQDIQGSIEHCKMLVATDIISNEDGIAIQDGLKQIEDEITAGEFEFSAALEDIHMNIEARLTDLIGPTAGRLHTARSRNDQAVTDFKLWVRDAYDQTDEALKALQLVLINKAEENADVIIPGFTHLQNAQPVTFGHHLMAYFEMFTRDRARFADGRKRLNECPLGAGGPCRNILSY